MSPEERLKLMHKTLQELVSIINTTPYAIAGELLYVDPEFTIDYRKFCQTRPYMSIPFWAGVTETGLKYTLHTDVMDDRAFIVIKNSGGEVVVSLWDDKLNVYMVNIVIGRLLYILNRLYWDIKLGVDTNPSEFDVITVLTQTALDIWEVVPPGDERNSYCESIMAGLSNKYKEMLARTELTSDAFKQQKE